MRRLTRLREFIEPWDRLERRLQDLNGLADLALEEDDDSIEADVQAGVEAGRSELEQLELSSVLTGEQDVANAILTVNAGAGGADACDWAEMLLKMYAGWAQAHGMDFQVVDELRGEIAGVSSATARVQGDQAYGYLKAEQGVHRLIRFSPFNASKSRETSFASVAVVPEVEDDAEIEVDEADLRIDFYRAGGAGGQHVNKTDSAVRITHLPTGIVVSCQNERSQHANRRTAMTILRARLAQRQREQEEAEVAAARGEQRAIEFGHQIRSYFIHPSTRVKDHRTGLETPDVHGVLGGAIDGFIRAQLQQLAAQGTAPS